MLNKKKLGYLSKQKKMTKRFFTINKEKRKNLANNIKNLYLKKHNPISSTSFFTKKKIINNNREKKIC